MGVDESAREGGAAAGVSEFVLGPGRTLVLDAGVAATIASNPRMTILPPQQAANSRDASAVKSALDAASVASLGGGATGTALELGRTLGEGGMGIVRAGTQRALGREVAVKTLRDESRTGEAALKLMREAWVTGALEHPNVVPVYDLATNADGAPVIVLKRIEGESWSAWMHEPSEKILARFSVADPLEWNLRVLLQVCNAVHFAHSRGIIHRDIKPENVMLGRFGEVYLLDWGIAVALEDDGSGRFPLAHDAKSLAGTPAYMAPEMLGGKSPALSPRADVYLLGAALYEIVNGVPPHVAPDDFTGRAAASSTDATAVSSYESAIPAPSVLALLGRIATREPPIPASMPGPLARICERALARDPEQRHASADALRVELEAFLRHRGASRLADEARRRLGELRDALTEVRALPRTTFTGASAVSDVEAEQAELEEERRAHLRDRVHRLLGECRFGFRNALREWPDDESARDGLREALELVAAFEIERRDLGAADAVCAEIEGGPSPELRAKLDELRREQQSDASRRARLEELGVQMDAGVGQRTRVVIASLMGLLWLGVPTTSWVLNIPITTLGMAYSGGIFFVAFAGLIVWARESMMRTAVNRRVAATVLQVAFVQVLLAVGAAKLGVPPRFFHPALMIMWGLTTASLATNIEKRLWGGAVAYYVGAAIGAARPDLWRQVTIAANLVLLGSVWAAWGRGVEWEVPRRLRRRRRA